MRSGRTLPSQVCGHQDRGNTKTHPRCGLLCHNVTLTSVSRRPTSRIIINRQKWTPTSWGCLFWNYGHVGFRLNMYPPCGEAFGRNCISCGRCRTVERIARVVSPSSLVTAFQFRIVNADVGMVARRGPSAARRKAIPARTFAPDDLKQQPVFSPESLSRQRMRSDERAIPVACPWFQEVQKQAEQRAGRQSSAARRLVRDRIEQPAFRSRRVPEQIKLVRRYS